MYLMLNSEVGGCVLRNRSGLLRCSKALLSLHFSGLLSIRMKGPGRVFTPRSILRLILLLITLHFHQTTSACWTQFVPLVLAQFLLWHWCPLFSRELLDKIVNFLGMFPFWRQQDASPMPFSLWAQTLGQSVRSQKSLWAQILGHRAWGPVGLFGYRYWDRVFHRSLLWA